MDVEDIVADTQKEDASRTLRKYVAELVRSLEHVLTQKVGAPRRSTAFANVLGMHSCAREA